MQRRNLFFVDVSGSIRASQLEEVIDVAKEMDADVASFDNHLNLPPTYSRTITTVGQLRGGGGSYLTDSLRELRDFDPEKYMNYKIFVVSDLMLEPPRPYNWNELFLNVIFVALPSVSSDHSDDRTEQENIDRFRKAINVANPGASGSAMNRRIVTVSFSTIHQSLGL
jgi:hypothetical protein